MASEILMPSEVARLVYGYFLEMGCEKSAKTFLDESPHLKEFAAGIHNGYRYTTLINQKSLIQILNGIDAGASNVSRDSKLENGEKSCPERIDHSQYLTLVDMISNCINLLHKLEDRISRVEQNCYLNSTPSRDSSQNSLNKTPLHHHRRVFFENSYSPRRKCLTPRRLMHSDILSTSTASFAPSQTQQEDTSAEHCDNSSDTSCNTFLSPISSSACETSESSSTVVDFVIDPKSIYNELLNCKPLQEKLANKINKKITNDFNESLNESGIILDASNSSVNQAMNCSFKQNEFAIGNIEKDLLPAHILEEILNSILDEPECNELVELVIGKEFNISPSTKQTISANSTPTISVNSEQCNSGKEANLVNASSKTNVSIGSVVKNLANHWPATPVKCSSNSIKDGSQEISADENKILVSKFDDKLKCKDDYVVPTTTTTTSIASKNNIVSTSLASMSRTPYKSRSSISNKLAAAGLLPVRKTNRFGGFQKKQRAVREAKQYAASSGVGGGDGCIGGTQILISHGKIQPKNQPAVLPANVFSTTPSKSTHETPPGCSAQLFSKVILPANCLTNIEKTTPSVIIPVQNEPNHTNLLHATSSSKQIVLSTSLPTSSSICPSSASTSLIPSQQSIFYLNNETYKIINYSNPLIPINPVVTATVASSLNLKKLVTIAPSINTKLNPVLNEPTASERAISSSSSSSNIVSKHSRPVPAILSKSKSSKSSSNKDISHKTADTSSSAAAAIITTTIVESLSDNEKPLKSNSTKSTESNEMVEKRKIVHIPSSNVSVSPNKRRQPLSHPPEPPAATIKNTPDPKIKTLLNIDMEKFLGNIHSPQSSKTDSKNK